MDFLEVLNALGSVCTAIGVFVAVWAIREARKTEQRQANMEVFMAYTVRFEQIMAAFPPNAFAARNSLDAALPPESTELTMAALRYLNLTSEEYYLWKRGYLAHDVWSIWEAEIKRTLCSPTIRREWQQLQYEFVSYSQFRQYVDELHHNDAAQHHHARELLETLLVPSSSGTPSKDPSRAR